MENDALVYKTAETQVGVFIDPIGGFVIKCVRY